MIPHGKLKMDFRKKNQIKHYDLSLNTEKKKNWGKNWIGACRQHGLNAT